MIQRLAQSTYPLSALQDWQFDNNSKLKLSAVLIPVVIKNNNHSIIFTQRTQHLNHHAGQISFPGGRAEAGDKNAVDTALRETHEEVGIALKQIHVTGFLDLYTTVSDFSITPIVGYIDKNYQTSIDPFEVDEVFEVPCEVLFNINNYQRNEILWLGEKHLFWELNYQDRRIWGATAAILRNFAERLI